MYIECVAQKRVKYTDYAAASSLLDHLYRGILVAEERSLDVHVEELIQVLCGDYRQ